LLAFAAQGPFVFAAFARLAFAAQWPFAVA
jgi:hypothetical protein